MKTYQLFTTLFLFCIVLSSCSSDDDSRSQTTKLVKTERMLDSNEYRDYTYNSEGILTEIIKYTPSTIQSNYTYDSNNNLIESSYDSGLMQSTTSYVYDDNNKLLSVRSRNSLSDIPYTEMYSYNNNEVIVEVAASFRHFTAHLEINNSGLVSKITRNDFYVTITYSNGNISEVKKFDNNNNLLNSHTYLYDDKPNPFYGQFDSVYLRSFITFRDDDYVVMMGDDLVQVMLGEAFFGGYSGYSGYQFPFLRNNVTSVYVNGNLKRTLTYSYDIDNYPIQSIENNISNATNVSFDIEYY